MDENKPSHAAVDHFFSAPSLRTDKWVEVLAAARAFQRGKPEAVDRIKALLADLAPLEAYLLTRA